MTSIRRIIKSIGNPCCYCNSIHNFRIWRIRVEEGVDEMNTMRFFFLVLDWCKLIWENVEESQFSHMEVNRVNCNNNNNITI